MNDRRIKRVGEEIRDILAETILRDMRDPRLPTVFSITEVKVSKDISIATVYFTQMPDDETSVAETLEGLRSGAGFLQTTIANRLTLRKHPALKFRHDTAAQNYEKIDSLLRRVAREDEKRKNEAEPKEAAEES